LPLPGYIEVLDAQMLLYANAWMAAGKSDTATVKSLLEKDLRFWRRVLASSDVLITKMIAVAALKRHFYWSNAILRRLPSAVVMEGVPDSWSQPISEQERSMLRSLVGEWRFSDGMTKQIKDGHITLLDYGEEVSLLDNVVWFFVSPTLKTQDGSNIYAELILETVDMLEVPYEKFPQASERARAFWDQRKESAFPSRAYNITGDYLFSSGSWDLVSYSDRVNDLEGIRRIAVAATELRSRGIPIQQVPEALLNMNTGNPYTGGPFTWDEEQGAIVFQGLEPGERGTHSLVY
jgi:hypothetical protein